jgi:hypothetical protein
VPVVVYTGTLTDATAAEIDRILGQHAETHRGDLTVGETIASFGQLTALGQSPARIARCSHTPRKTDDDPDAIKALVTAAKSGENTAHVAQRLRDQRATTQAIAALTAQLKDAGVAVIGEPSYDEKVVRRLEHLRHDGSPSPPTPTPPAPGTPPT